MKPWQRPLSKEPGTPFTLTASERLAARMAELDARFEPERRASEQAMRIVDRDLPHHPLAAIYDPAGFEASAQRKGDRDNLYRKLMADWREGRAAA